MIGQLGDLRAQEMPRGHEAHVDPREEKHQSHICIKHPHDDLDELPLAQMERNDLKHGEKGDDGQQPQGHLLNIGREPRCKIGPHIGGGLQVRDGKGCITQVRGVVAQSQDHNSQNGPDAAQRHHAEAVRLRVLMAAQGGQPGTHGHNKGHGNRPRGNAAGIKSHGQKFLGHQKGQQKNQSVKAN